MEYRKDIDGLRGVAILFVLLFHLKVPGFTGGFVGVDVFFVVSGFLLTRIIQDGLQKGTFSLGDFYYRRARRILPALIMVTFAVACLSLLILAPLDLRALGRDVVATLLFSSNVVTYARTPGYFAAGMDFNPLLMTWSLGVEEQFYLVWPLILLALHRIGYRLSLLAAATLVSFAVSAYQSHAAPTAAFYLITSRFWELALGGLLAQNAVARSLDRLGKAKSAFVPLGLIAMLASVVFLHEDVPFPGFTALLPTLAAALVIAGHQRPGLGGRILQSRLPVFVGKISYSLYLWHWPLLAFARWLNGEKMPLSPLLALACGLASFPLAYVSWKYVEVPWRTREMPRFRFLGRVAFGAAVTCAVGALMFATSGLPQRYSAGQLAAVRDAHSPSPACAETDGSPDVSPSVLERCAVGPASGAKVLVWGDSHAEALFPGLAEYFVGQNQQVLALTRSGCTPLQGWKSDDSTCARNNRFVETELQRHPEIETVVVAGYWGAVLGGGADPSSQLRERLEATLGHLATLSKRIVLFADVPTFPFRVAVCHTNFLLPGFTYRLQYGDDCRMKRADAVVSFAKANAVAKAVADSFPAVCQVDLSPQICDDAWCQSKIGQTILYRDHDHLSASGARYLTAQSPLAKCFGEPGLRNAH